MKKLFLLVWFLLLYANVFIEANSLPDSLQRFSSEDIIQKGIGLYNQGRYEDAIKMYNFISQVDPKYPVACYETGLCLFYLNNYEKALGKCRETESLKYEDASVYSLIGSILDNMGKPLEGIEVLEKSLKTYPYNQNILYNLAVCYYNSNQLEKAESVIFKSILVNPYHLRSHQLLYSVNYSMGRIAQAYLAYSMVVLLNPTIENVGNFEKIVALRSKIIPKSYLYPYKINEDSLKWQRLKWILNSELSFKEEFDFDHKLNYTIPRQLDILFQNMTYVPSDTSLYNQLYVRLFSEVYSRKELETYFFYIFKNFDIKSVSEWYRKNKEVNDAFVTKIGKVINERRNYGFSYELENAGNQFYHFDSNGTLISTGDLKINISTGKWTYINKDGSIDRKGNFTENKKEGEWHILYPNSTLKQKLYYKGDEFEGQCFTYYPNGQIEGIYPMAKGLKNGTVKKFTSSGMMLSDENYLNDVQSGISKYCFYKEGFKTEALYANDSLNGTKTEVWLNDVKKAEIGYKNGFEDGPFKTWYPTSVMEKNFAFKKGIKYGQWLSYYPNGLKNVISSYDSIGKLTGDYLIYDSNDKLKMLESTYKNGKLNGSHTEYFPDGKNQEILSYKNDTFLSSKNFNNKGDLINESQLHDGLIRYKTYYPDGTIWEMGQYKNNKKSGQWITFNPIGIQINEQNYTDGMLSGVQKTYYPDQSLKIMYSCDSDKIIGNYIEYFENGHPSVEGQYNINGKNGEWVSRFVNDSIKYRDFYHNDQRTGAVLDYRSDGTISTREFINEEEKSIRLIKYKSDTAIAYDLFYDYGEFNYNDKYKDGSVKTIIHIKDNLVDGKQESFYPNGQKMYDKNYLFGSLNGRYIKFDYNGDTLVDIPYVLGNVEGKIRWFKNGKLNTVRNFENDKAHGKRLRYHPNGQIAADAFELNDMDQGYAYYYAPDGTVMYRILYINDVLKAYSYQRKDKTFIDDIVIDKTTSKMTAYYPNGIISCSIDLKNGQYDGNFITHYPDGKVLVSCSYTKDKNNGSFKKYYPNGQLMESVNYLMDEMDGTYTLFYENGKVWKIGTYSIDEPDKEWKVYDIYGLKKATLLYLKGELYEIKR